jgi:putative MFS transporter
VEITVVCIVLSVCLSKHYGLTALNLSTPRPGISGPPTTDIGRDIAARIERLPLSRWHFKIAVPIGMGWFFDSFDAYAIAFVMPVLIGLWDLGPGEIGALIGIGYVGQIIGSIFFGWLAERIGRVPCAVYALTLFSVLSLVAALSWSYPTLLAARFVQGLGLGGEIPVISTYVNEWAKSQRRGRFAIAYQLLFPVGITASSLAAAFIVPRFGWQWMFVVGAVPVIVTLPLMLRLPESPRWLANRGRFSDADRVLRKVEDEIAGATGKPLPPIPSDIPPVKEAQGNFRFLFRGLYRQRTLMIWAIWFCNSIVAYGLSTWMPSLYRSVYQATVQQSINIGLYLSMTGLLGVLVTIFLIDKVGRKPILVTGLFLASIPLFVLSRGGFELWEVGWLVCAAFFGVSTLAIMLSTYTAELYSTEQRALGVGIGNAWQRFASVVGPFMVGAVLPLAGIGSVYLMFGIFALVGSIVAFLFAIETRGSVLEKLSPSLS